MMGTPWHPDTQKPCHPSNKATSGTAFFSLNSLPVDPNLGGKPSLKRKAGSPNLVGGQFRSTSTCAATSRHKGRSKDRAPKLPTYDSRLCNMNDLGLHQSESPLNEPELSHTSRKHEMSIRERVRAHKSGAEACIAQRDTHAPTRVPSEIFKLDQTFQAASNPSISKFPLPPYVCHPTPANSSEGKDEPSTPTVYHFRGASFEFINPSDSLHIQDIETPAEPDPDRLAYFMSNHRLKTYAGIESKQSTMPAFDNKSHLERRTPPRALFQDLPSAYRSITSRTLPSTENSASHQQGVRNSSAPTRSSKTQEQTKTLHPNEDLNVYDQSSPTKFSAVSSFRQRLVKGLHHLDASPNQFHSLEYLGPGESSRHLNSRLKESPTNNKRESEDSKINFDNDGSPSPSNDLSSAQADFKGAKLKAESRSSPIFKVAKRDEGFTEDFIDSYNHDYGAAICYGAWSYPTRHHSLPLLNSRSSVATTNKQTDSTIGDILDQYHRENTPSQTLAGSPGPQTSQVVSEPFESTSESLSADSFEEERQNREVCFVANIGTPEKVRRATHRALNSHIGAAPLLPLPANPPERTWRRRSESPRNEITGCSSYPSALSYGETKNLLLFPQSTADVPKFPNLVKKNDNEDTTCPLQFSPTAGRGQKIQIRAVSDLYKSDKEGGSKKSFDAIVNQDIKYLRQLSGLSDFGGSVYVVGGNDSVISATEANRATGSAPQFKSHRSNATTSGIGSRIPAEAVCVPVAAFQQSSVVPGIFRLASSQRIAISNGVFKHREDYNEFVGFDPFQSSDIHNNMDENEKNQDIDDMKTDSFDWETLPDSRATFPSQVIEGDCFEDWSSHNSRDSADSSTAGLDTESLLPNHRILAKSSGKPSTHDSPFEFGKRLQPSNRIFTDSTKQKLHNMYKHPIPLSKTFENPFTSSPPQITGSSPPTIAFRRQPRESTELASKEDKDISISSDGNRNVPLIIDECANRFNSESSENVPAELSGESNLDGFNVTTLSRSSSGWLSTEAGPEVSLEAQHGSPLESSKLQSKERSVKLSSGVDPSLVRLLRRGDPRMASSPLSRSNSFAKLSHLGPKSNITGSPNGTGMREVGSSLVGSSPLDRTAIHNCKISDIKRWSLSLSRSGRDGRSPIAIPEESFTFGKFDELSKHEGATSFRDAMMAESRAEALAKPELAFQKGRSNERQLRHTRSSKELVEHVYAKENSNEPDLARALAAILPLPVTSSSLPKLRRRYRSPSSHLSETRARKQRLSWVLFGACAILPYMLILYGHGLLDVAIAYWTEDQIRHCGHRQKTLAKIVGWASAAVTIAVVVVLFVVIRTIPNNLPR